MGKAKKMKGRTKPPVPTGHDDRPEGKSAAERMKERQASAPDGVSGNWS